MKVILLNFAIFFATSVFANLRPEPSIIDTIRFFDEGKWSLSLTVYSDQFGDKPLDSILLCSGSDTMYLDSTAFVDLPSVYESNYRCIKIYSDSLPQPFLLNPKTDSLSVACFYVFTYSGVYIESYRDSIVWGDQGGCCVRGVTINEYITSYPSFGTCNNMVCNENGCEFTLKGNIFNGDGMPLKNISLKFNGIGYLVSDDSGKYSGGSYAGKYLDVNALYYSYKGSFDYENKYFDIEPITITGNPGDTIYQDIHLKEMFVSEKETEQAESAMFFSYPNPAGKEIHFSYRIPEAVSDCMLEIFNIEGVSVGRLAVTQKEGDLQYMLGDQYPAGSYTYVVCNDKTVIYRGRFFVK